MRKADDLHVPNVKKIRGLNLPDPQGPVQACSGTALLLLKDTHDFSYRPYELPTRSNSYLILKQYAIEMGTCFHKISSVLLSIYNSHPQAQNSWLLSHSACTSIPCNTIRMNSNIRQFSHTRCVDYWKAHFTPKTLKVPEMCQENARYCHNVGIYI